MTDRGMACTADTTPISVSVRHFSSALRERFTSLLLQLTLEKNQRCNRWFPAACLGDVDGTRVPALLCGGLLDAWPILPCRRRAWSVLLLSPPSVWTGGLYIYIVLCAMDDAIKSRRDCLRCCVSMVSIQMHWGCATLRDEHLVRLRACVCACVREGMHEMMPSYAQNASSVGATPYLSSLSRTHPPGLVASVPPFGP